MTVEKFATLRVIKRKSLCTNTRLVSLGLPHTVSRSLWTFASYNLFFRFLSCSGNKINRMRKERKKLFKWKLKNFEKSKENFPHWVARNVRERRLQSHHDFSQCFFSCLYEWSMERHPCWIYMHSKTFTFLEHETVSAMPVESAIRFSPKRLHRVPNRSMYDKRGIFSRRREILSRFFFIFFEVVTSSANKHYKRVRFVMCKCKLDGEGIF